MRTLFIIYCFLLFFLPAIQSQNAPVTTTGVITTAVPGDPSVSIPITITGFNDIGQFTLTMKFDTTRVHYVSSITNPSLPGMTVNYTSPPSGYTQGQLVLNWTGASNTSLADGSSLADLTFSYVFGTAILSWDYIYGSVCKYKRYVGGILTVQNDNPKDLFYLNGGISDRTAPVTFAPVFTNPVPGALSLPITVNGLTGIGALTLYLEYDPAIITYQNSFTKNPAFGSSFVVGDVPGTAGKRMIVIEWYGAGVTLADGSTLCTLNFNYPSASCNPCTLGWYDFGPSCEYADGTGDVLIDLPQAEYYMNGLVSEGLLYMWTGNISSAWDDSGNWNACGIPDITRQVIIPDVSPHSFPVINVAASCKSIKIQTGATLSVGPAGSINVGNN